MEITWLNPGKPQWNMIEWTKNVEYVANLNNNISRVEKTWLHPGKPQQYLIECWVHGAPQ